MVQVRIDFQGAPQRAAGQHMEPHIDRLSREVFAHVVRICAVKPPGNLIGRAVLRQLCLDILPQPRVHEFA